MGNLDTNGYTDELVQVAGALVPLKPIRRLQSHHGEETVEADVKQYLTIKRSLEHSYRSNKKSCEDNRRKVLSEARCDNEDQKL
jgi:hypothetical protein